jgi:hypothetical protein
MDVDGSSRTAGVRPVPPTGHWHDDYERGRPGWPAQVTDVAGTPAAATVLELGAGTGKLTRLLVTRFARAIAVEPDEDMRRPLMSVCPDADVRTGSAEAIPLADRSVEAVFAPPRRSTGSTASARLPRSHECSRRAARLP